MRILPVKIGAEIGDLVAVSGLTEGTRVIVNPPEGLTEGRAVTEAAQ